ncbi:MAG: hypothetical protein ACFFCT_03680 [Candidatus Odinarchaeota archaeon]
MGDPKLLTRFREFCDAYKAEYAFEGIVEGLDTIDYIVPERLTRGLYVRTINGLKLVDNRSRRKHPVEVGDRIVVVGRNRALVDSRDGRRVENVLPAVFIILERKQVYFPKAYKIRNLDSFKLIQLLGSIYVISTGVWLVVTTNPTIELIGMLIILALYVPSFSISEYILRPRLYSCDEETWCTLLEELASKFDVTFSESIT